VIGFDADHHPAGLCDRHVNVAVVFSPIVPRQKLSDQLPTLWCYNVLGQYEDYCDVEGVADDSSTDTVVAARLWIETAVWSFDLSGDGEIDIAMTVKEPGPKAYGQSRPHGFWR
jgi:hypothetical protein